MSHRTYNHCLSDDSLRCRCYYITKIEELLLTVTDKRQNVRRLQAQRNELNAKVRMLREELQHLQEQCSYVGEVVKPMDKKKVLVKVRNPALIRSKSDPTVFRCTPRGSSWWMWTRTSTSTT